MAITHKNKRTGVPNYPTPVMVADWQDSHDVDTLDLLGVTADPSPLSNGMVWYRSDLNQLRARVNGSTVTLGASTWGAITGTLSSQTDLQTALDGKSNTGHTHAFADLTAKPTTLAGYGITDVRLDPALQPASTEWVANGFAASSTALFANNHIQGFWLCPYDMTIDQIAINVATAGSAGVTAKVTLYIATSEDKPGTLLFESPTIAVDTTGVKTVALSSSQVLQRGAVYWWGVRASGNVTVSTASGSNTIGMHLIATPTIASRSAISRSATYASGTQTPWVWSNSEYSSAGMPLIFMRRA